MAITFVGTTANGNIGTFNLPSGWQAGDVAFAASSSGGSTPPTGWLERRVPIGTAGGAALIWYRVLQSGDSTTQTMGASSDVSCVVWRGVHQQYPIAGFAQSDNTLASSTSVTMPALNAGASALVIGVVASGSSSVSSFPSGTTLRSVAASTSFAWVEANSVGSWAGGTFTLIATAIMTAASIALRPDTASVSFPIVADMDTTSGTVTSNSTSWTLTYPTNIAAGDLLLMMLGSDGNPTLNAINSNGADGWVVAHLTGNASATELILAKKVAVGTETGSLTLTLSATEQGAWTVLRIPAGTWEGTLGTSLTSPSAATHGSVTQVASSGATANPDPASLDPFNWATENTLWFAVAAADTSRTFSAFPSTFTNTGSVVSGGSTGASLGFARLESAVSSLDPGTFTISASDDWAASTIAIRPAAVIAVNPRKIFQIRQATNRASSF